MGQYGNQPDFATKVEKLTVIPAVNLNSPAIYIGVVIDPSVDATITVRAVGSEEDVTFSGITGGIFLPVIVKTITSVTNVAMESILLIY